MRLKIEITGGLFGDTGKNRAGNKATVIQLRFCLCVVQDNESDKFRMVSRQVTAERNDILSFFIAAVWIDFFSGAGLSGDYETRNSGDRGGANVTDDTTPCPPNLACRLPWHHLP